MLPVLQVSSSGELKISDAVRMLADQLHLTDEERSELLPSGRQTTFANRVAWAKSYLSKAGLVDSARRAHFQITARGKQVLKAKPKRIDIRFLLQFPEFRAFREGSQEGESPSDAHIEPSATLTPDEVIRNAALRLEEELGVELLARVCSAPPDFFERIVVQLLLAMGYGGTAAEAGRALGRSGDGGVDGVIDQDTLGLDRIYVQAKRYADGNNVGPSAIRDFFGSLDRFKASKGLFVTTSSFSGAAKETADFLSKRIVLIDGRMFARLMIRYNVGCRVEEVVQLKKVDEDFFE
jgi:restriction system protein